MKLVPTIALLSLLVFGCAPETAPNPVPVADASSDCEPARRPSLCADANRADICNRDGLLNAAMCYDAPGPDPLPELAGMYPSYGCVAPKDSNTGSGVEWTFWCCSKVTPGPLERACWTCSNTDCLY